MNEPTPIAQQPGFADFLTGVSELVTNKPPDFPGTASLILRLAERYANVRVQDLPQHPLRFALQANRTPPINLGPAGFRADLVESTVDNVARHYTAFLFVGFWMPAALATLVLWSWEILGFLRYGGHWSQPDILTGRIGIDHGRLVRQYGPTILPSLLVRDLAEDRL
jgi:hypothetical protein